MHVLRFLRIFIPLLLVAAVVAAGVLALTSRHDLQRSRRQVEDAWAPLRRSLDTRYSALALANDKVRPIPGPMHALVTQVDTAYAGWRGLERRGASVTAEVNAANTLESLGRRLLLAARAAPRLVGNQPATSALDAFDTLPAPAGAAPFDDAVRRFERVRDGTARRVAARILDYGSIPAYDSPA